MWELEKKKHEATSRPGGRQRLCVSNSWSGRHWERDQGPAVGDRTDIVQLGTGHPCGRRRRSTACGPSTTRGCVPRGRRPDARRHATVPQAWMQREYWEFETHRADISKSFLWEVEQGSGISGDRLLRVANVLGASLDYLLRGEPAPADFKPAKVEIPSEVHELAQELGLTYSQTMALLQVDRSVIAHRRDVRIARNKEYWRRLYESVKEFLEDEP